MSSDQPRLNRTLGLSDAVLIGVGSMIGAGVYSVWSPATRSAGPLLLVGLAVAALVANVNARSTARLARLYPESGGTYVYGRECLGPTWGFLAGWGFVAGKTASCAAMASTIGAYLLPEHTRPIAVAAIVVMTLINIGGIHRTVFVTRILLTLSAFVLLIVIVSGSSSSTFDAGSLWPLTDVTDDRSSIRQMYDVLQSAGLLFFAFAGYARIATLGEEVRDPVRNISRAIGIALSIVVVAYAAIGFTLLATVSPSQIADVNDPLRLLVSSSTFDDLAPLVRFGAVIAALGALLNLLPGVSRTAFAMARHRDLPNFFAKIDSRRSLPVRAELTVAACAIAIILIFGLRNSIALSGVGVLSYYSITHLSSLTLSSTGLQRLNAMVGLVGCVGLIACLPLSILLTGAVLLLVGVVGHSLHRRLTSPRS
ncbi:MAG: APC family permease [Actinomycetota bacterium]